MTARVADRIGKGVRGAPRDALVADITPPHLRGAAYGLRQSLDTGGAFLGPLLAVGLMLLWASNFRLLFWVAVIPGLIAVALLVFGVREPAHQRSQLMSITRSRSISAALVMRARIVLAAAADGEPNSAIAQRLQLTRATRVSGVCVSGAEHQRTL